MNHIFISKANVRINVYRVITLFVSVGFWIIYSVWKKIQRISGNQGSGTCVVLYYHGIANKQRRRFAQQLDDIIKFSEPVPADIKMDLEDGSNYIAVTFDDAFVSIIENALPELNRRNIPFTIFVPTQYIGLKPGWLNGDFRRQIDDVVISVNQLKELNKNDLVCIGSHCVTHRNLLSLNEKEAKREILESKYVLETILKKEVKTLSFPHGYFKNEHVEWALQAGYERIFTILPTLASFNKSEYLTGRILVHPTNWKLEFRLKILGAYRWVPLAVSLKRKLKSYFSSVYSS